MSLTKDSNGNVVQLGQLDGSGNLTITAAPEAPSTFANVSGFEFEFD